MDVVLDEPERCLFRYLRREEGLPMASRKGPEPAPEEALEANRRNLVHLAAACGEEAGLHRPLNEIVGGVITGIPEEADLAQALSDRETSDILVHLLDENREQVEHALERVREGAYGTCEGCARKIPAERLRYQPAATRCVECQSQWDRMNGRTA
jgi:RNA polymerase-binding transcription factor DksA